jgi:hypothetical protein
MNELRLGLMIRWATMLELDTLVGVLLNIDLDDKAVLDFSETLIKIELTRKGII